MEILILLVDLVKHLVDVSVDPLLELLVFFFKLLEILLGLIDVDLIEVILVAGNTKELFFIVNPRMLFKKI